MGSFVRPLGVALCAALIACSAYGAGNEPQGDDSLDNGDLGDDAGSSGGRGTSSSSGGSSTSSSGGDSDAGPVDAGPDVDESTFPTFFDDFARSGSSIGNGWTAKQSKFSLSNEAVKQTNTGDFKDLWLHRPTPTEDVLDVDLSVDVTYPSNVADPGLYARIQWNASSQSDYLVGYTLYAGDSTDLYIDRNDPGTGTNVIVNIAHGTIDPPLTIGVPAHFTFRVTGTNPVVLAGSVSDAAGNVLATASGSDGSASRVQTAGTVGFGSGDANNALYDNFKRVTLP